MASPIYKLIRSGLFKLYPETAHNITMSGLKLIGDFPAGLFLPRALGLIPKSYPLYQPQSPNSEINFFNLKLTNPVGLGAGFDKDGEYIHELFLLGFGFIELGTATPKPQAGNTLPRLFRLPKYRALINRMGFNNQGVDNLVKNIYNYRHNYQNQNSYSKIIGVNIGKNALTPNESALNDYLYCLNTAHSMADYLAINISSPNTKNLRQLQNADSLKPLLLAIREQQIKLNQQSSRSVPLLVKIAPDLVDEDLQAMCQVFAELEIDGLIISNTTISREMVCNHPLAQEIGGLSGFPLKQKANEILAKVRKLLPKTIIIGVGGIETAQDALDKKTLGADVVQLYTGFIYEGAKLIEDITDNWR